MFENTLKQLIEIEQNFRNEMNKAMTSEDAQKIRKEILGKSGELDKILRTFKDMLPDERRNIGIKVNELKNEVEASYNRIIEKIKEQNNK